jgi:hypothetical protein
MADPGEHTGETGDKFNLGLELDIILFYDYCGIIQCMTTAPSFAFDSIPM